MPARKSKTAVLCRACGNKLEKKFGNLKWRHTASPDNNYPGTLLATQYFWCAVCNKGYMDSEECGSDISKERARQGDYVFVVAPITSPTKVVSVVDWLPDVAHAH